MGKQQLNARVQHKIDTYENWLKAINFTPLHGELIIYTTDEFGDKKIGLKIGDGETKVNDLDFISSAAPPVESPENPDGTVSVTGAVRYDLTQNLTEGQKSLARKNIGASSVQFITWEEND